MISESMVKLLYVFAGISLKETIDAIKFLYQEHLKALEKEKESINQYRPVPAVLKDSVEAHTLIAAHQHRIAVAPQVKKIINKIRLWRLVPVFSWAILTFALMGVIVFAEARLESAKASASHNQQPQTISPDKAS